MPWIPVLGMFACIGLMAFLPTVTWIRFGVWTIIGVIVYLGYGMRHSRLANARELTGPSGRMEKEL
jgi:APA family basic amino acid/polyamine antiporter